MRAVAGLIALCVAMTTQASAEPEAGSGFGLEVERVPGAIFAGLARDGDSLLITNLADGRLYRRTPDGNLAPFGPVLPHGKDVIGDPTGPYRVVRHGKRYLVAQGWTPADQDEGPNDHALLEVDDSAVVRVVSNDFWNPYDFAVSGDALYLVDAARNAVERLAIGDGARTPVFTFARLTVSGEALTTLSPTEFGDTRNYEFDAVPTGIAAHGGRLYVSLFGGYPFVAGSGRIVSLPEAGKATAARIEATDLNAPVDIAFNRKGEMLVLEHGMFDQAGGWRPGTGRLLLLEPQTGKRQVLVGGLTRPVAVLPLDDLEIVVSQLDGTLLFLKSLEPTSAEKPR